MTDKKNPLEGLSLTQAEKVVEYSHQAPASLMARLNWGLDCHPGNISRWKDSILECDVELRLTWGRALFDKIKASWPSKEKT